VKFHSQKLPTDATAFPFWRLKVTPPGYCLAFLHDCGNNNSMSDVVQSVRQLLQDFISPELRELKSDVKQVDAKIDSESSILKAKIDSETKRLEDKIGHLEGKIVSEVGRLEDKIVSEVGRLEGKVVSEVGRLEGKIVSEVGRLEDKVDSGFAQMRTLLENAYLRSELEATRDISNLRERVTRLEVERGAPRQ
jgi:hypothetical protein